MKVNWKEHSICGIYCIKNLITNKVYIGKSLNIAPRVAGHKSALNRNCKKSENHHFINAWLKYGAENFDYTVLEVIPKSTENLNQFMNERELHWIDEYQSTNRHFGYNLRRDSSSNMIVHDETRLKFSIATTGDKNGNYGKKWTDKMKKDLSDLKKEMFKNGEHKVASTFDLGEKAITAKLKKWKENPELMKLMNDRVNIVRLKYAIHQYSHDGSTLIKEWKDILELMENHPEYKKQNIYAVCSGEKPTMYKFKWVKVLKVKSDNIVRSELKGSVNNG